MVRRKARQSEVIEKLKSLLRRWPWAYKTIFSWYLHLRAIADSPRYAWCRLTGRRYFGPVMLGSQTWRSRAPHMRALLAAELKRSDLADNFRILEIGSWAGESALLWASGLVQENRAGQVICVDPWAPYATDESIGVNTAISLMDRVARRDKIFPLFWHNVRASGLQHVIVPFRGRSKTVLQMLKPQTFDLIFVDGSHAYSDFIADLSLATPLLKEHGVICGDDLECQFPEVDQTNLRSNCERDFVFDPKTGQEYHPGVCLGVHDFFKKQVSCYDGFWIQRKTGTSWSDV